jgi:Flp pilus assembly protein TadD
LAPADGRWWLGLGWCLDAQGNAAEARDAFLRARQSGNLSPELLDTHRPEAALNLKTSSQRREGAKIAKETTG